MTFRPRPIRRIIAAVYAAQFLICIGSAFWPVLLPRLTDLWMLNYYEAGWITSAYYLAYLISVPVLVTATDRVDPKIIYMAGAAAMLTGHLLFALVAHDFWTAIAARAFAGCGEAGTFMVSLKLLADRVDKESLSRTVAGHAACISVSFAASFTIAEPLARVLQWHGLFLVAATGALCAGLVVCTFVPLRQDGRKSSEDRQPLWSFLPVLRNKAAMAYALAYGVHTLETQAFRNWMIAFLGFTAANSVGVTVISPVAVATVFILLATVSSFVGNEVSLRRGRRWLIGLAFLASAALGAAIGFIGPLSYGLAAALALAYGIAMALDSASLTAGTAGSADPARRGATLAVHSMVGYAGGVVGPVVVGLILDLMGGMSGLSWGLAFLSIAILDLLGLALFSIMKPPELIGDGPGVR
jgi:MFS family permease